MRQEDATPTIVRSLTQCLHYPIYTRSHTAMRDRIQAARLALMLVLGAAMVVVAPALAQDGKGGAAPDVPGSSHDPADWMQIGEYQACIDGVAYYVSGHNTEADDTWWNWVTYGGSQADPWLVDEYVNPLPVGDFNVLLVQYFDPAYAALIPVSLPLNPGDRIYFDAYQSRLYGDNGFAYDERHYVPVEDCLIDEWLAAPDEWTTCRTNMHIFSTDGAPADGVVEVRTLFGDLFRPEGWTEATIAVAAGQRLDNDVTVGCARHVRVWFTPTGGTPTLLPSQYYPDDFGSGWDGTASYHTNFAGRVAPTDPLEDPGTSE
ncbi:MAG: hypothetical protein Kow00120_01420 [Anaerolineae bacterium]